MFSNVTRFPYCAFHAKNFKYSMLILLMNFNPLRKGHRNSALRCVIVLTAYLNKVKLVSVPCFLRQRVCVIQDA